MKQIPEPPVIQVANGKNYIEDVLSKDFDPRLLNGFTDDGAYFKEMLKKQGFSGIPRVVKKKSLRN